MPEYRYCKGSFFYSLTNLSRRTSNQMVQERYWAAFYLVSPSLLELLTYDEHASTWGRYY